MGEVENFSRKKYYKLSNDLKKKMARKKGNADSITLDSAGFDMRFMSI